MYIHIYIYIYKNMYVSVTLLDVYIVKHLLNNFSRGEKIYIVGGPFFLKVTKTGKGR